MFSTSLSYTRLRLPPPATTHRTLMATVQTVQCAVQVGGKPVPSGFRFATESHPPAPYPTVPAEFERADPERCARGTSAFVPSIAAAQEIKQQLIELLWPLHLG